MIEAPLDDVLYVGQFIAVSVFEWLYFEGVIIQGWVGGWVWCLWCLCPSRGGRGRGLGAGGYRGKLSQLVYYQECLHRGSGQDRVCPLRNRNIFLHQSHHQSAASSYSRSLRMDDIRTQKDLFCSFFSFFKDKETVSSFAWLSVVFLLACVPGKSMTIVWTLTYRCVWNC